jgi:hypothetical protein
MTKITILTYFTNFLFDIGKFYSITRSYVVSGAINHISLPFLLFHRIDISGFFGLISLNFEYDQIETLTKGSIGAMHSLESIILDENKIVNVDGISVLKGVHSLRHMRTIERS